MKIEEIRGKTSDELEIELQKTRREVFDLRFKSSTQALTSPARIRQLRRLVARMETVLSERRLGQPGSLQHQGPYPLEVVEHTPIASVKLEQQVPAEPSSVHHASSLNSEPGASFRSSLQMNPSST